MKNYYIYVIWIIIFVIMFMWFTKEHNLNTNLKIDKQNEEIVQSIWTLNTKDFKNALLTWEYTLIDLRTIWELHDTWVIWKNYNIDFYKSTYNKILMSLDKNKKYLIYCRSWHRSSQSLNIMKSLWFKNVHDLKWGIKSWQKDWEILVVYK